MIPWPSLTGNGSPFKKPAKITSWYLEGSGRAAVWYAENTQIHVAMESINLKFDHEKTAAGQGSKMMKTMHTRHIFGRPQHGIVHPRSSSIFQIWYIYIYPLGIKLKHRWLWNPPIDTATGKSSYQTGNFQLALFDPCCLENWDGRLQVSFKANVGMAKKAWNLTWHGLLPEMTQAHVSEMHFFCSKKSGHFFVLRLKGMDDFMPPGSQWPWSTGCSRSIKLWELHFRGSTEITCNTVFNGKVGPICWAQLGKIRNRFQSWTVLGWWIRSLGFERKPSFWNPRACDGFHHERLGPLQTTAFRCYFPGHLDFLGIILLGKGNRFMVWLDVAVAIALDLSQCSIWCWGF